MKKVYKTNLVNDLTTFKGMPNANVIVLGNLTVGDGNGGSYYWDDTSVAAPDGINIIQVTGVVIGRWIKLSSASIDPNDFIQNQTSVTQSASYKIDGEGTLGNFVVNGSISGDGILGADFSSVLTATANTQTQVAVDVNPFFISGGFSNLTQIPLRVQTTGGSPTGELVRLQDNNARLTFWNETGTTNHAYLVANSTDGLVIASGTGLNMFLRLGDIAPNFVSMFAGTRNMVIQATGTVVDSGERLQVNGTGKFNGGGETLKVGTYSGGSDFAHIGFYPRTANPTVRSGIMGYTIAGNDTLIVRNEIVGGNTTIATTSTGTVFLVNGVSTLAVTPTNIQLLSSAVSVSNLLTVNGIGEFKAGGEAIKVGTNTGNPDFSYIGLYPRSASPTTRSALIGFQFAGTTNLNIRNEISNGSISILTTGNANVGIFASGNNSSVQFGGDQITQAPTGTTANWSNILGLDAVAQSNSLILNSALGSTSGGSTLVLRTSSGTSGLIATLLNNTLGSIKFGGYRQTAANQYDSISIRSFATENWSSTAAGSKLEFYTTPNATIVQTLALTIDQNQMLIGKNYRNNTSALVGTAIDFSAEGSRYQTIAADTNYTTTNTAEGLGIDLLITASGANRTITIAGVVWKGSPTLVITSGNAALIRLKQINGTVYGTFVQ